MTVAPGLETFLKPMSLLWFSMPLSLTASNLYVLLGFDFSSPVSHSLRSFMVFSSNLIDFSSLTVSVDCVVASFTRNQDPLLKKKIHGYIASVFCFAITLCVALAYHFDRPKFADALSYFSMTAHISSFVIEVTLLIINTNRHKIIPFAYKLSVRHKLVRNIKLLRMLVPFLFTTTIFSILASNAVVYLIKLKIISTVIGVQLIYSFYNAAFLLVIFAFIWNCYKQAAKSRIVCINSNQQATSDHFQQLKALWG